MYKYATLLGTPVQLLVTQIDNQPITWQQLNAFRHQDAVKMTFWSSNRASEWGKKGALSDFECGMFVCARRAGLSISETADLLGFSHTTISENGPKREHIQWAAVVWTKMPCWCQRRIGRQFRDDRKATVTQITTHYNQGMQNTISEHTTHQTLKQIGYSSRRPHRVLLLSAKNRKQKLQF